MWNGMDAVSWAHRYWMITSISASIDLLSSALALYVSALPTICHAKWYPTTCRYIFLRCTVFLKLYIMHNVFLQHYYPTPHRMFQEPNPVTIRSSGGLSQQFPVTCHVDIISLIVLIAYCTTWNGIKTSDPIACIDSKVKISFCFEVGALLPMHSIWGLNFWSVSLEILHSRAIRLTLVYHLQTLC